MQHHYGQWHTRLSHKAALLVVPRHDHGSHDDLIRGYINSSRQRLLTTSPHLSQRRSVPPRASYGTTAASHTRTQVLCQVQQSSSSTCPRQKRSAPPRRQQQQVPLAALHLALGALQ